MRLLPPDDSAHGSHASLEEFAEDRDLNCRFLPPSGILPILAMSSSNQSIRPASARIERGPGTARIHFTVPVDCYFCQGHFPDQPVVPGAVLASWMLEAAELAAPDQKLRRLQNLKFRRHLIPGDPVAVNAQTRDSSVCVTVQSRERACADAIVLP